MEQNGHTTHINYICGIIGSCKHKLRSMDHTRFLCTWIIISWPWFPSKSNVVVLTIKKPNDQLRTWMILSQLHRLIYANSSAWV